ncbi:hypothetical protein ACF0H5_018572 [Mactra antiquata]
MKFLCAFLILPALAFAAPEKRFFLDSISGLISTDVLKQDLQIMLDLLGSDPTEQACEAEAAKLLGTGLIQHSVPLICHSFQALVNSFNLVPDTTTVAVQKRFFLDNLGHIISTDVLKQDLQIMLDLLGSDPTEQACEAEATKLLGDGLIQHSVPLICHSFQALINHFKITPDVTTAASV